MILMILCSISLIQLHSSRPVLAVFEIEADQDVLEGRHCHAIVFFGGVAWAEIQPASEAFNNVTLILSEMLKIGIRDFHGAGDVVV